MVLQGFVPHAPPIKPKMKNNSSVRDKKTRVNLRSAISDHGEKVLRELKQRSVNHKIKRKKSPKEKPPVVINGTKFDPKKFVIFKG